MALIQKKEKMQASGFNVELDKDEYDKLERDVSRLQDALDILKG
jgi:CRISPR/Cas system-associated endoribonuclease Cas2